MDIPLILEDEAIGVMNFESRKEGAFSEDDERFMKLLASQAVLAILNATTFAREQRISQERQALISIVETLISHTDTKDIFNLILKKGLEITNSSYGTINTCDFYRQKIQVVASVGTLEEYDQRVRGFDEGIIGLVARQKVIINISDLNTDPRREMYINPFPIPMRSELAVPIIEGDDIRGVINIESPNPNHFGEDDIELVKSIVSYAIIALQHAERIQDKKMAEVGSVTGVFLHDIKTPISKIQTYIDLIHLNHSELLNKNKQLANYIVMIDKISTDTREMIKGKTAKVRRSFAAIERTSLKHVICEAVSEIDIPDEIELIDLISSSEGIPDVKGTPELADVFRNLIINAIQVMPKGGKIYLRADPNGDNNMIIISVEDTGPGIPKNLVPLIYLPFTAKEGGQGFGLPLSKAYIEMIDGVMEDPTPGEGGIGAKFSIHLQKYNW